MFGNELDVFTRIAVALERQVQQVDEQVARNAAMRAENIERHERELAADLAEARASNQAMVEKMNEATAVSAALLLLLQAREQPPSVDAVDPSAGIQESGPRARENETTTAARLPSPEEPAR